MGTVADRGALLAGGDGGEAFQLAGIAVPDIGIAAQRGGAVTGGLAAAAVRGGVGGTGQAVQAGDGGVLGERHRAAAERRRAVTDRIGRFTCRGRVGALDVRTHAVVVRVGPRPDAVVRAVRGERKTAL